MTKNKKFHMYDVVLSVICVVYAVEATTPTAAIGNTQYFWWIFLIITFLLPYGLITSELGSTYSEDEGGIYSWVRRAFGDKWGSRTAWLYWINFPLWMASLAVLFPTVISLLIGYDLGAIPSLIIDLAFIWIVILLSLSKVSDSAWIMNLGAVLKMLIFVILGVLGVTYAVQHGMANTGDIRSYFPSFSDVNSLTYLSVILLNFMGFEVIATYTEAMDNPKKQIPRAIIIGGITVAAIYLISAFSIGAAIPADELSLDSGILDAISLMSGSGTVLAIISIIFLMTLFGNMVSWSYGVNYVTAQAAHDGNMPKVFGIMSKKNDMPVGATVMNGIIASILCCVSIIPGIGGDSGIFWIFFATNIVFLLLSYAIMFPAFLKLRKIDPDRPRPFKAPGNSVMLKVETFVPLAMLFLAIISTIIPFNGSEEELSKIPMLILVIIFVIVGEVVRIVCAKGRAAATGSPDPDENKPVA